MVCQLPPSGEENCVRTKYKSAKKTPVVARERIEVRNFAEGAASRLLYTGPHSKKLVTIARLLESVAEQGCTPSGKHHETS